MLISTSYPPTATFHEVDSYSFALTIFVPNAGKINERQTGGSTFVNGQGTSTDSCTNAVMYTLINDHLFFNTSNGATQFGAPSNVKYTTFVPQANPGAIITTFSVDAQNNLIWSNVAFYNNFAQWCIRADNTVIPVFVAPNLAPNDCVFIQLSLIRCGCWRPSLMFRRTDRVSEHMCGQQYGPSGLWISGGNRIQRH